MGPGVPDERSDTRIFRFLEPGSAALCGLLAEHLEPGRIRDPKETLSRARREARVPRPHTLHRPAFLWSNRSEVWGRDLVDLAWIRRSRLMP
jgi:hypothetical protein